MARNRIWIALVLFAAAAYAATTLTEQYCGQAGDRRDEPCARALERAFHARHLRPREPAPGAPLDDGLQRCFEPPVRRRSWLCGP
ncbi:MAG TPA: hypothetical protein VFT22_02595 [Kofleriaceae bacterium]|nr:hypothetical protein [Kofleriaceae bacterium]